MAIYDFTDPGDLLAPIIVAAMDGWVDAGTAATTAAQHLAADGEVVVTFDGDALFDYRARRPTLEIVDGALAELTWPDLTVRRARHDGRDLLVLTGAEPDFRWHAFTTAVLEIAERTGAAQWVSLGAIPAAVPHTRTVPIIGTASRDGLLRADVRPGPVGMLRVPSAALSVLEMQIARTSIPAVGYFAQIPHYTSGPYPAAAAELLRVVGRHLAIEPPLGDLPEEARQLRARLDLAAGADETTRAYVERLEAMVDEERLPSGDDLIGEIERFLRDQGGGAGRSGGTGGEGGPRG